MATEYLIRDSIIAGHHDSIAQAIPNDNADWSEFAEVVYNDDNSVEVERIVKFGSPQFHFSPFKTTVEQMGDRVDLDSSALPEDSAWIQTFLNENESRENLQGVVHVDTKKSLAVDMERMKTRNVDGTPSSVKNQYYQGSQIQNPPSQSKKKKVQHEGTAEKMHSTSHSKKKKVKSRSPVHDIPSHSTPKKKSKKLSSSPIKEGAIISSNQEDGGNIVLLSHTRASKQKKETGMKPPKDNSIPKDDRPLDRRTINSDKISFEPLPSPLSDSQHKKKSSSRESFGSSVNPNDEKTVTPAKNGGSTRSNSQIRSQSPGPRRHSIPSHEEKSNDPKLKTPSISSLYSEKPPRSKASTTVITSTPIQQRFIPPKGMATRSLVTASVYHNQATGLWITTINTNQYHQSIKTTNASKYLKAFSFHSEREAREAAYAYAPPKMWPLDTQTTCFSCDTAFSLFKRSSHCRNCGACVCSSCCVMWNKLMIPETYNNNDENAVKICKSCDVLSRLFRQALLDGNYDDVISIYNTGNVNLRCPFMNVKGAEVLYPIHCAILGGNLDIIVWLIDVHFCPIKVFRTGNKYGEQGSDEQLISTSKGRDVLDMALDGKNVDILRYLICDKNISVFGVRDISSLIGAFDVAMKALGPLRDDGCYMDEYQPSDDNSTIVVSYVADVAS